MELQEIINLCQVKGNTIILPELTLERKQYLQVKKIMETNGAKWKGGKIQGFVCNQPEEILQRLQKGELSDRRKQYQFFQTPITTGEYIAAKLGEITPEMKVLEPSAGQGALITAIRNVYGHNICPDYCELMPENRTSLKRNFTDCKLVGEDFLKTEGLEGKYDRILANPPFMKNQDIRHIKHMYNCLKTNGRMVSICSPHFEFASDKESSEFRQWLIDVEATVEILPKGTFHQSGTEIESRILIIQK